MTQPEEKIRAHYGQSGLYERILTGLVGAGVEPERLTAEDLKAVDEFHIGGVNATQALLDPLGFTADTRVLDLGSGIGGPARFMAQRYGCKVTGLDLTPEFLETARKLTEAVGLSVDFVVGSALDLPFEADSFDAVTLIHVGMNLPDKPKLFAEVARVLRPGGVFAVYDVMRHGAHPAFPLPWAETEAASFLAAPDEYREAARAAGLTEIHCEGKGDVARVFFAEMQARLAQSGPPPVGLPLLMGETAPQKASNMAAAVGSGDIEPIEMIFRKG